MKKLILSIFLVILLAITSFAAEPFFTDVIVTSPNGIWTDARAYSTLNDAVAAVGANERTIVIASPQVVTTLTIPSTVTLKFERNGSITNSGYLNIQTKNIIADNRQIFTGVGNIDFAVGSVIKTGWFSNIESAFALTTNDTVTLEISKPATVTANYSPNANINLKWTSPGNILTVTAGTTLSNLKNIEAGNFQIFGTTGDVDFVTGALLKSGWFANIESAFTLTSDDTVTLLITKPQTITSSSSPGNNINLKWESPGNILTAGAGIIVGNLKNIEAGDFQLFAGTGDLDFLDGTSLRLSWFPDFHTTINWIEDEEVTLIITGTNTVDQADTILANVLLDFTSARGELSIDNGVTLSISPIVLANCLHQNFTGLGTLSFSAFPVDTTIDRTVYIGSSITVSSDLDISTYTNLKYSFVDAGKFSISITKTLIIYSPANIIAAPNQRLNSGAGLIAYSVTGAAYANRHCDGGTGTALDPWTGPSGGAGIFEAITAGAKHVKLLAGYYKIESAQTSALNGVRVSGQSKQDTIITWDSSISTGAVMTFSGTDVVWEDFYLSGNGTAGTETALYISGSRAHVNRFNAYNVYNGISYQGEKSVVENGKITGPIGGTGILMGPSVQAGAVILRNVYIAQNTANVGTGYGLAFSASQTQMTVDSCNFELLSKGIYSAVSAGAGGFYGVGALSVIGSHFEANTTDLDIDSGTLNLTLIQCRLGGNATYATTTSLDFAGASSLKATIDGGRYTGVAIETVTQLVTHANTLVTILNMPQGWLPATVTGSGLVMYPKQIYVDPTDHATSGGGTDTMATFTMNVAGNTYNPLRTNGTVRVLAAGTKTDANNDVKTIRLAWGSTAINCIVTSQTADDWLVEATIQNANATGAQRISWVAWDGTTFTRGYTTATEDTTADVVIKMTGTVGGTTNDVITQTIYRVEID